MTTANLKRPPTVEIADGSTPITSEEADSGRQLLQTLLKNSRLYCSCTNYKELLDFVTKLRNFAPFNAMLLQIQKPGMQYAASSDDWAKIFNRSVKEGARPLLILWPFAPVALVYDVEDTAGAPLPEDVLSPFRASGIITQNRMTEYAGRLFSKGIDVGTIDCGPGLAGHIHSLEVGHASSNRAEKPSYRIRINAHHDVNTQFATLIHELAHLYLGHLGADVNLKIPSRARRSNEQTEFEAESVSYIICKRSGVDSASEVYLSGYLTSHTRIEEVDVLAILTAAGKIEAVLGLACHTTFGGRPVNYPLF
jgi:hypothetical protein